MPGAVANASDRNPSTSTMLISMNRQRRAPDGRRRSEAGFVATVTCPTPAAGHNDRKERKSSFDPSEVDIALYDPSTVQRECAEMCAKPYIASLRKRCRAVRSRLMPRALPSWRKFVSVAPSPSSRSVACFAEWVILTVSATGGCRDPQTLRTAQEAGQYSCMGASGTDTQSVREQPRRDAMPSFGMQSSQPTCDVIVQRSANSERSGSRSLLSGSARRWKRSDWNAGCGIG